MEKEEVKNVHGRVRHNTSEKINRQIDRSTLHNVRKYRNYSKEAIAERIKDLKKEWDIERTLEISASSLALIGIIISSFVNKKWNILSGIVMSFLLLHGLQGWCPPLPLFRRMGIRSRQEIEEEIYALKIVRGDFGNINPQTRSEEILEILRKKD